MDLDVLSWMTGREGRRDGSIVGGDRDESCVTSRHECKPRRHAQTAQRGDQHPAADPTQACKAAQLISGIGAPAAVLRQPDPVDAPDSIPFPAALRPAPPIGQDSTAAHRPAPIAPYPLLRRLSSLRPHPLLLYAQ